MLAKILIIDKRTELPAKYKKSLENNKTSVTIARTLKDGIEKIQSLEPEMILISDSIDEPLTSFCEKIRALTYNIRPIIVALSKSADSGDRILTLESGADDFLSEPVKIEEFKTRIQAHLRRDLELNLDTRTLLPNRKIVEKSLKRILNSEQKYAVLLIGIENLDKYKAVYSDIAAEKLIQTFVAITKSTLENDDFLGQLNDNHFVIITNIYRAEKMAAFLTFAFDTVVPKFYSEQDAKRGYSLLKGDRLAEMRVNFVSVQIGAISDIENISGVNSFLERLVSVKNKAKIPSGSSYLFERIKLTGENSGEDSLFNNCVYIQEQDEALALLLRTTLELQGYDVVEHLEADSEICPDIMIIDSGDNLEGLSLCKEYKKQNNFVNTKIIVTSSVHDKTAVLNSGADLYLPKPYEISDLVRWIEYFRQSDSRF